MNFTIQLHLTLINTIFKFCHALANLDNVNLLYVENGNVDRPVLKNIFVLNPFLVPKDNLSKCLSLILKRRDINLFAFIYSSEDTAKQGCS